VLASSPILTLITIALLIAVVLFEVGIERIINGLFLEGKHRLANVGRYSSSCVVRNRNGISLATGIFLLVFLAVAPLFDGISRVIHGASDRSGHRASRIFSIVAGVIEIGLSVMIMASPILGAEILSFLLSLSLLIVGIQMITSGVIGRRLALQG
jgi:uncharacterized membrane protein HdeD (DUF308 family)